MFFRKDKNQDENKDGRSSAYRLINQSNGDIYEGYLKDEKFDGLGTLYYSNKCFFKGYFKDGEKDRGIETFPNGDEYTGFYKNNKFHEEGVLENKRINYRYEGEFKEGIKEGKGTEKYKTGTMYAGEFKKNMRNGRGKLSKLDGTSYEGHFFNGMMHGYGIQIERSKFAKQKTFDKLSLTKEKTELLDVDEEKKNLEGLNEKSIDDSFYEGEFCFGYRHGIGRYYYKKGSYLYGEWRFDKSIGNVIYYFADENKWHLSFFDSSEKETILKTGNGFPPIKLDTYKSVIDECGIKNEKLEDQFFPNNIDVLGIKIPNPEEFSFFRVSELYKREKYNLFSESIKPGKFLFTPFSSPIELTCLDALCNYPPLILKLFTPKYSLDIGYFILKLYYDGNWKEILVDDYIPCLKNQPLLCTNFNEDIGWFILQKAIAKIYGSYFSEGNDKKIVEEFLKMLTGLPTKTINCLNINNCIASLQKYRDNKVKLIHFRDEYYKKYSILKNLPLILKDYIKINDQNGIFVVKNLEGILKIPDALDLTSLIPEYFELLKSQINFEDSHLHFFEKNTLKEIFSDINILLATEDLIMNSAKFAIFCEINDDFFQYDKYTFDFKITASSKTLINIEQLVYSEDQLLPLRINLAKIKEEAGIKKSQNKIKLIYIFGKGQHAKKDLYKEIFLECGTYILFLEFEVNSSISVYKRYVNVNIFSPFLLKINKRPNIMTFKHKIYKNLMTKSYDICNRENKEIKNFSFIDLKDKANGSEDLIIVQYFMKKEGTYLQYLMNKSKNRRWKQKLCFKLENMKIIKDLDFDSNSNDLDLILDPEKESLIIIQQIQGLNYGLEGGDGPCMIEIIPESDQKEHEQEKEKFPPKLHFDLEMNIKKMN